MRRGSISSGRRSCGIWTATGPPPVGRGGEDLHVKAECCLMPGLAEAGCGLERPGGRGARWAREAGAGGSLEVEADHLRARTRLGRRARARAAREALTAGRRGSTHRRHRGSGRARSGTRPHRALRRGRAARGVAGRGPSARGRTAASSSPGESASTAARQNSRPTTAARSSTSRSRRREGVEPAREERLEGRRHLPGLERPVGCHRRDLLEEERVALGASEASSRRRPGRTVRSAGTPSSSACDGVV